MASLHMDPISAPSLASGTSHYASRSSFSCHGIPPLPPDFSLQGRLVGGEDGARMGPSGGEKVDSEGHINDNKISFPSASPNSVRSIRWSGGAVHEVPPRSEVAFVHSPGAVVPFCRPCPSIPCMLVETVAALAAAAAAFARRTHLLAGCESASTPVLANRLRIPRRWAWILLLSFFDISFHLVGVEGDAFSCATLDTRGLGTLTVFAPRPPCTRCTRTLTDRRRQTW